jgi:glycosyltransferase involved in cell wall biosynthesis
MKPSISIIIPALDEENNLAPTVELVVKAVSQKFGDYELLIFNDGSRDRTGEIADQLALQNSHVRVTHHPQNMGLGYTYREGIQLASKEYVTFLPGDTNRILLVEDIENIMAPTGQADMVLVHVLTDARPLLRRVISQNFTRVMNLLFGLQVKYFNGPNIYRSASIKQVKMSTDSYGLFAETLVRLLKSGHNYVEVGVPNRDKHSNSKALRMKNFIQVGQLIFKLFWDVQIMATFTGKQSYKKQGAKVTL